MQDIGADEAPAVKRTSGLQGRVDHNKFIFSKEVKTTPAKRRGMISTIASLNNPLGFIAPVILQGRVLLQQVCRGAADWDDSVTCDVEREWLQWIESLKSLQSIQIPHSFIPPKFKKTVKAELHHFSDASELGYGQC
ncbi:Gag-pol fusion polyprotein [Elysia marginata]|uniref:Gag-pol fusion polyprotein n=1 Tax=Elysia marginata TaxID=1093978 RepID=A0AAV4IWI0_9GAST|nr:Gag-pol fusion polyprotein [Elysia marginata]